MRIVASVAVATTACYSPELRDCTLACLQTSDCADGQVCGGDGFCANPELAGQCGTRPPRDARTSETDGDIESPLDAASDAPPDAATHGVIAVTIAGKGHVVVGNHGTCDSDAPQNGMCQFTVPLADPVTVEATAEWLWLFDQWTTSTCPDEQVRSCTFWPAASIEVGAKFRKLTGNDGDD